MAYDMSISGSLIQKKQKTLKLKPSAENGEKKARHGAPQTE